MSLRILFADDSMTAQNMGKKILSDAGYDVVAVSNGAAAVKKIAEQKPDIIILDVYMPGYSGLEVCEKVRGSLDTLKTPVLLTVGKMEPLVKPEDANRVKADGVIIKPFEASDLLAIVKKFEERIGNMPPPPLAKPAVVERYEEEEAAPAEMPVESSTSANRSGMQPMVEVPDHMASSAAFGDLLGSEPASSPAHFAVNTPSAAFETSVIVPAPPVPVIEHEAHEAPAAIHEEAEAAAPAAMAAPTPVEEEAPVSVARVEEAEPIVATPLQPAAEALAPEIDASPEVAVTPVEAAPEITATPHFPAASRSEEPHFEPAPQPAFEQASHPTFESAATAEAAPAPVADTPHPHFIPVFKEPEPPAPAYDFVPTAAPRIDDIEITREPALEQSAEETTRSTRADMVEPGLMSPLAHAQPAEPQPPMHDPVAAAPASPSPAEAGYAAVLHAADAPPEVSDTDFEARVAAAMAAYNHGSDIEIPVTPVSEPEPVLEQAQTHAHAASVAATEIDVAPESAHSVPAAVPSFEYHPAAPEPVVENVPEPAPAISPAGITEAAVTAEMEAAIPEAVAAAAESGADHHTISQVVHRVMERLKPELVEEIMKELKSKK